MTRNSYIKSLRNRFQLVDNYLRQVNILFLANHIQSNEKELHGQVLSEILPLWNVPIQISVSSRVVTAIANRADSDMEVWYSHQGCKSIWLETLGLILLHFDHFGAIVVSPVELLGLKAGVMHNKTKQWSQEELVTLFFQGRKRVCFAVVSSCVIREAKCLSKSCNSSLQEVVLIQQGA